MTRRSIILTASIALLLTLMLAAGCGEVKTQTTQRQIIRTCVAVGTDGSTMTGRCAQYDLRYAIGDSMPLVNKWDSCPRITGLKAPSPAGQIDSFPFPLTVYKDRPYFYSLKVADSLGRWSPKSNNVREVYAADPPPAITTLK